MLIMQTDDWVGLELRHLLALKAVSEEGSFGRAAKRLGYTQSAISQQIAVLERIVGHRLVDRPGGPRPISITEAGELLLTHADGITARLRAAQADLSALATGNAGPLRVGTYQSVGARILPTLLRNFREEWPETDVTLVESTEDRELLGFIESGEVDLSFVIFPLGPGPFQSAELLQDPYVLLVPKDSPLAQRDRPPTLREIVELPLIGYRSCHTTQQVEARLRGAGREPHVVFRSDDNYTVQGMVAAGIGVALVPLLTVDPSDDRLAVLDLRDRIPARVIGIAWHRDRLRTPAAAAFVEAAQALCKDFEAASLAA
jgi:DNA-binding transcriptional LysR family regulator